MHNVTPNVGNGYRRTLEPKPAAELLKDALRSLVEIYNCTQFEGGETEQQLRAKMSLIRQITRKAINRASQV